MAIELSDVRSWVIAALINSSRGLNPDNRIAEVVYVVGRRMRELTGVWPFTECTSIREPYSTDFYLSFLENDGKVDPRFGYGPLAYRYCLKYMKDGKHK